MVNLITDHLDIWTATQMQKSNGGRGRGNNTNGQNLYGIKKLRELILELALRGKLAPQDPDDEPASVLLERISKEKNRLIKEGKIKKQKPLPEITEDEKPFELPEGWEWARLGNYGQVFSGNSFKSGDFNTENGVKVIKITNAGVGKFIETEDYLPINFLKEYESYVVNKNDLILALTRPYISTGLKISKCPENYHNSLLNQRVAAIRFCIEESYAYIFLRSNFVLNLFKERFGGTGLQPNLKVSDVTEIVLSIPPLAEQYRIVAKVDELMSLCDQMEQQQIKSNETHQTLVETLLTALTNATDQKECDKTWQRIADHFDTLFTTEQSIDQLKQTILQLAVMGKLVPQDPNDEPVSELLKRVKLNEAARIRNKEIQKPKKHTTDTKPGFHIPESWAFRTLNQLSFVTKLAGFEYTKYINLEDNGEVPVIRAQNVRPFKPDTTNLKYIDMETSLNLKRSALDKDALLVTFIGAGIGDVCLFNDTRRWHLAPNVAKVEPFADISLEYLNIYLNSQEGRKEIFKSIKSTAQPSLSMTTIREIWVPIPPTHEQHRIVAKVDELMALCDTLKERLNNTQTTKVQLADAIVEQAVA